MTYLDKNKLINDMKFFLKKYNTTIVNNSEKIALLFQISIYNDVIEFYKRKKFIVQVHNLQEGNFRYKQTPAGHPKNFSYFSVSKKYKTVLHSFDIHNNIAVQSELDDGIFVTPDIVISNSNSVEYLENHEYYLMNYPYIRNNNLQSFCEIKHYTPFPELLVSFIGILQELTNDIYNNKRKNKNPKHLAPSLILSGLHTKSTKKMAQILEERYSINIFDGLFIKRNKVRNTIYPHNTIGTK